MKHYTIEDTEENWNEGTVEDVDEDVEEDEEEDEDEDEEKSFIFRRWWNIIKASTTIFRQWRSFSPNSHMISNHLISPEPYPVN